MINLFLIITQRKYFAIAQLFLSLSLMFGTWVIYIPTITKNLQLTEGQLGIVLLFGAFGALFSLPFAKYFISVLGEGKLVFISILLYTVAVLGIFLTNSFFQLTFVFFFNGMFASFLQIGINSLVSTIEKEDNIAIMSSCHGFYSLGGIVSAGLGTMLLIYFNNPLYHILTMVFVVFLLQVFNYKFYIKSKKEAKNSIGFNFISISKLKNKALWGLAVIGVSAMLSEGAIADWSALYLNKVALSKTEIAGLGFAGFSTTMTLGRFLGDSLGKKIGALKMISFGYLFSVFGFLLVLTAIPLVSIIGFTIIGLGFSVIVPEVYRLSSNIKGVDASTGIAFIAGAGFLGFLVGPVALGAIADSFGLQLSFITVLGVALIGMVSTIIISYNKNSGVGEK